MLTFLNIQALDKKIPILTRNIERTRMKELEWKLVTVLASM